jgi:hypothetical protein
MDERECRFRGVMFVDVENRRVAEVSFGWRVRVRMFLPEE